MPCSTLGRSGKEDASFFRPGEPILRPSRGDLPQRKTDGIFGNCDTLLQVLKGLGGRSGSTVLNLWAVTHPGVTG